MTPPRRWSLALVALTAVVASACGCGSTTDEGKGPGTSASTTTESSTTSTTAQFAPAEDQTEPKSTFGLVFDVNKIWIADFLGGEVIAVDPDSGAILKRYKSDSGVPEEVASVAVGPDGSVYWTGFNDGLVGRMSPANISVPIVNVQTGASGIAFSDDGKLYVGRAVIADGLWQVDPSGIKKEIKISENIGNMKSFAVGTDGYIYGPQYATAGKGSVVKIHPVTGEVTQLTAGFDGPISAKFNPERTKLYVLSMPPGGRPKLDAVDLTTYAVTPLPSPKTPLVDDLTVAPDGRIFVSAYNSPELNVIRPDGDVKTIGVGHRT
jgi:sugar lactone lactonase YvrE